MRGGPLEHIDAPAILEGEAGPENVLLTQGDGLPIHWLQLERDKEAIIEDHMAAQATS